MTALRNFLTFQMPIIVVVCTVLALVGVDLVRSFEAWWEGDSQPESVIAEAGTIIDEQTGQEAVVNYTKFTTLTYKSFAVVSGWTYDRSGEKPSQQYCYATITKLFSNAAETISLANKKGDGPVRYTALNAPEVRPFKISAAEMMALAKSHCRFTEGSKAAPKPKTEPRRRDSGERDA